MSLARTSLEGGVFVAGYPPKTATALEGRYLTDLPEDRERLAEGLDGPGHDPRRALEDVADELSREAGGTSGHVPRVLGVDVLGEAQGGAAVAAAAGPKVIREVQKLVLALHTATRTDQDGVRLDLQVFPFKKVALALVNAALTLPMDQASLLPDGLLEVYPIS